MRPFLPSPVRLRRLKNQHYQKTALRLLSAAVPHGVSPEFRIRQKLESWNQSTVIGHACRRLHRHWLQAHRLVNPAARAAHFRLIWNGGTTDRRLLHVNSPCPFGCPHGRDDVSHYVVCDVLWHFLRHLPPCSAGIVTRGQVPLLAPRLVSFGLFDRWDRAENLACQGGDLSCARRLQICYA